MTTLVVEGIILILVAICWYLGMPPYGLVAIFAVLVGLELVLHMLADVDRRIDRLQNDEERHWEQLNLRSKNMEDRLLEYLIRLDNKLHEAANADDVGRRSSGPSSQGGTPV